MGSKMNIDHWTVFEYFDKLGNIIFEVWVSYNLMEHRVLTYHTVLNWQKNLFINRLMTGSGERFIYKNIYLQKTMVTA